MNLEQTADLMKRAIKFQYGEYDNGYYGTANVFHIEMRNDNIYAITDGSSCYDKEMNYFTYEPLPSSRTEEFFKNTRFTLDEAMEIANKIETEGLYNFKQRRFKEMKEEGMFND